MNTLQLRNGEKNVLDKFSQTFSFPLSKRWYYLYNQDLSELQSVFLPLCKSNLPAEQIRIASSFSLFSLIVSSKRPGLSQSFSQLFSWSVCHNFVKGKEVTLPYSNSSTCLFKISLYIFIIRLTTLMFREYLVHKTQHCQWQKQSQMQ